MVVRLNLKYSNKADADPDKSGSGTDKGQSGAGTGVNRPIAGQNRPLGRQGCSFMRQIGTDFIVRGIFDDTHRNWAEAPTGARAWSVVGAAGFGVFPQTGSFPESTASQRLPR